MCVKIKFAPKTGAFLAHLVHLDAFERTLCMPRECDTIHFPKSQFSVYHLKIKLSKILIKCGCCLKKYCKITD